MKSLTTMFMMVLVAACRVLIAGEFADETLQLIDVFQLEYAADPQISPDGQFIVSVRSFMDIMEDRRRSNLWIINADGSNHRPLTTGSENHHSPRWPPDGTRLLYLSGEEHTAQVYVRWMDTRQTARLAQLPGTAGGIAWSSDGSQVAFSMPVPVPVAPFVKMPPKPNGATWADPPKVIQKVAHILKWFEMYRQQEG